MSTLAETVNEINQKLEVGLSYTADFYNISEQKTKNDSQGVEKQFIVARRDGTQGQLPIPKPGNSLVFYHRILEESLSDVPGGKGNKVAQMSQTTMRLVCYGPRQGIGKDQNNLDSHEFLMEVLRILNQNPTYTNKETVIINGDQSSVYQTVREDELPTLLPKELIFEMVAFYVDYRVKRRINCNQIEDMEIGTYFAAAFDSEPTNGKYKRADFQEISRIRYSTYFNQIRKIAASTIVDGSPVVQVNSTSRLVPGMPVEGSINIPSGTTILTIDSETQLTLSDNATGSQTTNLSYIHPLAGFGDGSSTFNVPNFEGKIILGASSDTDPTDRKPGTVGGSETNTLTTSQLPPHNHDALFTGNVNVAPTVNSGVGSLASPIGNYLSQSTPISMQSVNLYESVNSGDKMAEMNESVTGSVNIENTGNGETINNLQPYSSEVIWIRVL